MFKRTVALRNRSLAVGTCLGVLGQVLCYEKLVSASFLEAGQDSLRGHGSSPAIPSVMGKGQLIRHHTFPHPLLYHFPNAGPQP
jgi:hypothetical protein